MSESEFEYFTNTGKNAGLPGYDAFGNPLLTNVNSIPVKFNIGNDTVSSTLNLGNAIGNLNKLDSNNSSWWDTAKSGFNWFIGNKDFSPANTLLKGLELYYGIDANEELLNFQKQKHQDEMNYSRLNALTAMNNTIANANLQAKRLEGFNPERAAEYASTFLGNAKDLISGAEGIGISSNNFANTLEQLNQLANRKVG